MRWDAISSQGSPLTPHFILASARQGSHQDNRHVGKKTLTLNEAGTGSLASFKAAAIFQRGSHACLRPLQLLCYCRGQNHASATPPRATPPPIKSPRSGLSPSTAQPQPYDITCISVDFVGDQGRELALHKVVLRKGVVHCCLCMRCGDGHSGSKSYKEVNT